MTEGSGCDDNNPKGRRNDSVPGPSAVQPSVLRRSEQIIAKVLRTLDEADQTPDLLEGNPVPIDSHDLPELSGIERDADEQEMVPLAAYLFSIAGKCRDTVRNIREVCTRQAGRLITSGTLSRRSRTFAEPGPHISVCCATSRTLPGVGTRRLIMSWRASSVLEAGSLPNSTGIMWNCCLCWSMKIFDRAATSVMTRELMVSAGAVPCRPGSSVPVHAVIRWRQAAPAPRHPSLTTAVSATGCITKVLSRRAAPYAYVPELITEGSPPARGQLSDTRGRCNQGIRCPCLPYDHMQARYRTR